MIACVQLQNNFHHHLMFGLLPTQAMDIYVAGFPCTPYSSLGGLGRLNDPNARQLFACVNRVKRCRPKASLFMFDLLGAVILCMGVFLLFVLHVFHTQLSLPT